MFRKSTGLIFKYIVVTEVFFQVNVKGTEVQAMSYFRGQPWFMLRVKKRGPPSSALSIIGGVHIGAVALHVLNC